MQIETVTAILCRTETRQPTTWWWKAKGGEAVGPFTSKVDAIDSCHAAAITEAGEQVEARCAAVLTEAAR